MSPQPRNHDNPLTRKTRRIMLYLAKGGHAEKLPNLKAPGFHWRVTPPDCVKDWRWETDVDRSCRVLPSTIEALQAGGWISRQLLEPDEIVQADIPDWPCIVELFAGGNISGMIGTNGNLTVPLARLSRTHPHLYAFLRLRSYDP